MFKKIASACLIAFSIASVLLSGSPAFAQDPTELNESAASEMERVSISPASQVWEGLYNADVHVRYHTAMAEWFGRWALASKIALTGFSLLVLAFTLIHSEYVQARRWLKWLSVVGLMASIGFGYIPFSDWRNTHEVLAKRWSSLEHEWQSLRLGLDTASQEVISDRARTLLSSEAAIESAEPASLDDEFLEKCQDETDRRYGVGEFEKKV